MSDTGYKRGGTNQSARTQPALNPDSVCVDDRSLRDMIRFAMSYAKQLRFYDSTGKESGDWTGFLGSSESDINAIIDFIENPSRGGAYQQPHVALFLTFLKLLQHAQEQMNGITRRHLDYYYRQVLNLSQRSAVPDQAHVILSLAPNVDGAVLPAETLFNAGENRQYISREKEIINQAQAVQFRSIYAHRRVTGIKEIRENSDLPVKQAVVEMFRIIYGKPNLGDDLPPPPSPLPSLPQNQNLYEDVYQYLNNLQALVNFVWGGLFMSLPTFRTLMRLKARQDNVQDVWDSINNILQKAGRSRTKNENYNLNPKDPRDFDTNLATALGLTAPPKFQGLPDVTNIYELYAQPIPDKGTTDPITKAITETLYLKTTDDFYMMMGKKVSIDRDWEEIYRILQVAGRSKRGLNTLSDLIYDRHLPPPKFSDVLDKALGSITWPQNIKTIDEFNKMLEAIFTYFYMLPEEFALVMENKDSGKIDAIFDKAYYERHYAEWRERLSKFPKTGEGCTGMLNYAAGFDPQLDRATALAKLERSGKFHPEETTTTKILNNPADPTLKADEWEAFYGLLVQAMRLIIQIPLAQKVEWRNLYPAVDATHIRDRDTSWATFGRPQPSTIPSSSIGWAIRSPLLALSEGKRSITLKLTFDGKNFDAAAIRAVLPPDSNAINRNDRLSTPFIVDVSTEKGWAEPDTLIIRQSDDQSLELSLNFGEKAEPLAAFSGDNLSSGLPTLRIQLRQIIQTDGTYITQYEPFKNLHLAHATLGVKVEGLIPAQMQNDQSILSPKKPFEPFGIYPIAGSRFYLGHPELINKPINNLTFHVEWMGLPDNLTTHYKNYVEITDKTPFQATLSLIDNGILNISQEQKLFSAMASPASKNDLKLEKIHANSLEVITDSDLQNWSRYVQWELSSPDFQHDTYPKLATQMGTKLALDVASRTVVTKDGVPDLGAYQVNPPYTPKIKTLTLDYNASVVIQNSMYHIHPFGYLAIEQLTDGFPFLPQYDNEGELYIGLSAVQAPQDLSVLFQMAEDTPNPDAPPPPIQWSCLSGNQWISLESGAVLADHTQGLLKSGIIHFNLPTVQPNTLLPDDLYWLRAAIAYNSSGVCNTVGIHTQAIDLILHKGEVLSDPLPLGSITEMDEPLPGIAAVLQPYASFGSRIAEPDMLFYTRVSERLRHKQRALTMWDYEHLILDQFPQVYRVKCLPASDDQPGLVRIVIIPNLRNSLRFNPFAPKAPVALLREVEAFLAAHVPPYVEVRASNAHYVPVKLRFGVRFMPGVNETFYIKHLNDEINQFLSPWAYNPDTDIVIGGRIYANTLINFIEQLDYVDYVVEIRLFRSDDGGETWQPIHNNDGLWVEPIQEDGVLVAAEQHEIDVIVDDDYEPQNFEGINYMKIELDFIVGPWQDV